MPSQVLTSYVEDQSSPLPLPNMEVAMAELRGQLTALEGADVITPEQFGAVPNDPAFAVQNFAAIEAWMNAGHLGLQIANPNNVYYLACYPTGGDGAFRPLTVRRKCWIPILRLAIVKAGASFSYYALAFGNRISFGPDRLVGLDSPAAAITRGQTTFTVDDPDGPSITVGQRLFVALGHDAYDFDGANGWYRTVNCTAYSRNALTGEGTLTVDMPCPDDFPLRTDSRADTPKVYLVDPLDNFEGSWIGFMEMDMAGFDQSIGLAYPASIFDSPGLTIDTMVFKNPPRRDTQSLYFGAGSENITVGQLFFDQSVQAVDMNGKGQSGQFHNIGSRIDYLHVTVAGPDFLIFREGYTGAFTIGEADINFAGRFNGSNTDQFYKCGRRFCFAISECEPLIVGTLRYTSQFDLKLDTTDPTGAGDDGFWGAGANTGAALPIIERFESNKDFLYLGCTPLYVATKSVEGPLTYDTRHFEFPAAPAGQDMAVDYEAGRVFFADIQMNFGPDPTGWDFFIYTPPFVDDRSKIDQGVYVTHYKVYGGYAEDNRQPSAVWNEYIGPGYKGNVGQQTINLTTGGSFDRFFRYAGYAGEPAGNYMKLQYAYYPMKSLYQENRG